VCFEGKGMIVGAGTVMVLHKPQPQGYKIEIIKISLSNLALIFKRVVGPLHYTNKN
jgi:hypothetical protein